MNALRIEKNFVETLEFVEKYGITAETLPENEKLYNTLVTQAAEYFGKVVLLSGKNRSRINSTGIEFDEYVDDSVMQFLKNLDKILAVDEDGRIPYIVMMINNLVVSKVRSWHRIYGTGRKTNGKKNETSEENDLSDEEILLAEEELAAKKQSPEQEEALEADELDDEDEAPVKNKKPAADDKQGKVCFLDQAAWGYIADKHNTEKAFEDHEAALRILNALNNETSAYNAVAFMATKILGWKTSMYADRLYMYGYKNTRNVVVTMVSSIFGVEQEMFSRILNDDKDYQLTADADKFCKRLSNCSDKAKVKVREAILR